MCLETRICLEIAMLKTTDPGWAKWFQVLCGCYPCVILDKQDTENIILLLWWQLVDMKQGLVCRTGTVRETERLLWQLVTVRETERQRDCCDSWWQTEVTGGVMMVNHWHWWLAVVCCLDVAIWHNNIMFTNEIKWQIDRIKNIKLCFEQKNTTGAQ